MFLTNSWFLSVDQTAVGWSCKDFAEKFPFGYMKAEYIDHMPGFNPRAHDIRVMDGDSMRFAGLLYLPAVQVRKGSILVPSNRIPKSCGAFATYIEQIKQWCATGITSPGRPHRSACLPRGFALLLLKVLSCFLLVR